MNGFKLEQYALLYAGWLNGLSEKGTLWEILSSVFGGLIDSLIDVVQTVVFFSPSAQEKIHHMSSSSRDVEISLSYERVARSSKSNLKLLSFI